MTEQRRLDPIFYAQVFDGTPAGQKVLAELVDTFGAVTWIKGGPEADRETSRMLGRLQQRDPGAAPLSPVRCRRRGSEMSEATAGRYSRIGDLASSPPVWVVSPCGSPCRVRLTIPTGARSALRCARSIAEEVK